MTASSKAEGLSFRFQLLSKLEIYILLASVHFGLVLDGRKRPVRQSGPAAEAFLPNPKLKLLEQCREVLRFRHYSYRTEQTYHRMDCKRSSLFP